MHPVVKRLLSTVPVPESDIPKSKIDPATMLLAVGERALLSKVIRGRPFQGGTPIVRNGTSKLKTSAEGDREESKLLQIFVSPGLNFEVGDAVHPLEPVDSGVSNSTLQTRGTVWNEMTSSVTNPTHISFRRLLSFGTIVGEVQYFLIDSEPLERATLTNYDWRRPLWIQQRARDKG
ncbi:uncharacterized protein C8R40DRAFT_1067344 [Lentinula edodes]|uniref:uncharacterized protein n=1 Tax=Lentinula edodes TaxID=5353 RepID=UPI001E8DD6AC|nr:uncharacterized protein C8R40DRAFT_1067344 [Lentinula edodes]KAH7878319.1 hypothetical protein C8R40DRAFT_1067344 [Lentinula edodes]